jgi:mannosyltransferase OCH1-like enzyme
MLVHQVWLGGPIPPSVTEMMKTLDTPGVQHLVWTQKKVDLLMAHSRLEEVYRKERTRAGQVDCVRLELLHQYGGLYSDVDVVWLKSPATLMHLERVLYLCTEPTGVLNNAVMLADQPGHPAIYQLIDELESRGPRASRSILPQHSGPGLVSVLRTRKDVQPFPPGVILTPKDVRQIRGVLDRKDVENRHPGAFALHLYLNSWWGTPSDPLRYDRSPPSTD